MTDPHTREWDELNAFVDGELPADQAAILRARAGSDPLFALQVAGLRQLKVETRGAGRIRGRAGRNRRTMIVRTAVAVLVVACVGIGAFALWPSASQPDAIAVLVARYATALEPERPRGSPPRAIDRNATGFVPVLDLGPAGLTLTQVLAGDRAHPDPLLIYRGLHGCHVGFTIFGRDFPPDSAPIRNGMNVATWSLEGRLFALLARGMDETRFRRLAEAVESLSRGASQDSINVALRRSADGAACTG